MGSHFEVGDRVRWSSSSQGSTKEKTGVIVAIIPPGHSGQAIADREFSARRSTHRSAYGGGGRRDHQSYIVEVPGKTSKSKPFLYWPRAAALERT